MIPEQAESSTTWKPVPGWEHRFLVSEDGRVWSLARKREIKYVTHPTGYLMFATREGGRGSRARCLRVHRCVAEAFVPNPDDKPFVNHIDAVKQNNHVSNLEWATAQENTQHAESLGLLHRPLGMQQTQAKLTDEIVRYCRRAYRAGDPARNYRALAERFGVSHHTIRNAVVGRNWSHVE